VGIESAGYQVAVVDAFPLIEFLVQGPVTPEIARLFADENPASIATLNLAETYDVLIRVVGREAEQIDERIQEMALIGALEIVPLSDEVARRAGSLRAEHYDQRARNVSMADCVAAATAEALSDSLATPDSHLTEMAREIGLEVIALPDSSGRKP
jgi:predicted nucleic acid-binding protein